MKAPEIVDPPGLFPRAMPTDTDAEEITDGDETEETVEDEDSPEELESDAADDEESEVIDEEDEPDARYAELEETNRRLNQSIADREIRRKGFEADISEKFEKLEQLILNSKGADGSSVLDGKDPEDYTTVAEVRAQAKRLSDELNAKVDKLAKSDARGQVGTGQYRPNDDPEADWCDSQPDIKKINDFINKNRLRLTNDPGVQAAGPSQMKQYYAVKTFMLEEQLRVRNKQEKTRRDVNDKRREKGHLPDTEGITKNRGAMSNKKGGKDYLDKLYGGRHNRIQEY